MLLYYPLTKGLFAHRAGFFLESAVIFHARDIHVVFKCVCGCLFHRTRLRPSQRPRRALAWPCGPRSAAALASKAAAAAAAAAFLLTPGLQTPRQCLLPTSSALGCPRFGRCWRSRPWVGPPGLGARARRARQRQTRGVVTTTPKIWTQRAKARRGARRRASCWRPICARCAGAARRLEATVLRMNGPAQNRLQSLGDGYLCSISAAQDGFRTAFSVQSKFM
jgi:hypothetical protein